MTTIEYQNGNCLVTLAEDGTKTRTWEGEASPEFPESIDVKITNQCDGGCSFCHESSTVAGRHGDISWLHQRLLKLPAGIELAIGGGNPLAHPELFAMLDICKRRGWIANVTALNMHVLRQEAFLVKLLSERYIHGLGISSSYDYFITSYPGLSMFRDRIVYHAIAGVTKVMHVLKAAQLLDRPVHFLVLGYKRFGFGKKYFTEEVAASLDEWRYWIGTLMRSQAKISFDNLALEQLGVREKVTPGAWSRGFMGHDGEFTMYIDAVTRTYARSSTSVRQPMGTMTVAQAFQMVRKSLKNQS